MATTATRSVGEITPISRTSDARQVALAAYDRLLRQVEQLDRDGWSAPTECPGWDVAAMVGHVIGAGRACASVREMSRQQRWAKRHADGFDGNTLDAANDLQVRDHADLSTEERLDELRLIAPAAVRGRMRLPRPLRRVSLKLDAGGSTAAGMPERLSLGHLMDVIYTRDTWLHTIDIARATSTPFEADQDVDARIIEDVVAEWASRHGQPFDLHLTGPAGQRLRAGTGGARLEIDAVEFCRVLSGRAEPADVVASAPVADPGAAALLQTRLLF